jgi:hypothetical protein
LGPTCRAQPQIIIIIERHLPEYAEALYNQKALVQKLIEVTGETEWDGATMPDLLAMLIEEGVDVEQYRC